MESKENQWSEIERFYHEMVDIYRWDMKPMIDLLTLLKIYKFQEKYFPSISHDALGLCTEDKYEDRLVQTMVYLVYNMKSKKIDVHFQQGQGNTVRQESFDVEINGEILDSVEKWLTTIV